jgi:divalent metal cation (Fe/Co/Zn/Cd) transporter
MTFESPSVSLIDEVASSRLWRAAWLLSLFTIIYNVVEGVVSIWFGYDDETLALFGFGVDSIIEVISAIGVAHMVVRLQRHGSEHRDTFERTSLRVTGVSFYALTGTLVATSVLSIVTGHRPETTLSGLVVSLISIAFMWALIRAKVRVGTALTSAPIIADANCSKVCLRMSVVLLASSALYAAFAIPLVDALGALGLAWYAFHEGRECFDKARGLECCDGCHAD